MLLIYLGMKQERFPKRFRKWRKEGLLKVHSAMREVLEAIAWYA